MACWLKSRTPEREVWYSILTRGAVLCPWARHISSPKVLVIPRKRWLRPDMTEKLFTEMSDPGWSGSSLFAIPFASFWQYTLRFGLFKIGILSRLQQRFLAFQNLGTLQYSNIQYLLTSFVLFVLAGVSHYTKIVENSEDNVWFDETFQWPVARPIEKEEFIDIQLYNYNKYLSNK